MNEQNLKRYLDDGVAENYRTTIKVRKQVPATQLPQSYQRGKQM